MKLDPSLSQPFLNIETFSPLPSMFNLPRLCHNQGELSLLVLSKVESKSLKVLLASSDNHLGIVFIPDGSGVDVAGKVRLFFFLSRFCFAGSWNL